MRPQSTLPILSMLSLADAFSIPPARHPLYRGSPLLAKLSAELPSHHSANKSNNNATAHPQQKRKISLTWCNHGECSEALREQVVGEHNHIELGGPATGQVAYSWEKQLDHGQHHDRSAVEASTPAVLFLVKQDDVELAGVAADTIVELLERGVQVLLDDTLAHELSLLHRDELDLSSRLIRPFRPKPVPGFGTGIQLNTTATTTANAAIMHNNETKYNNTQQQHHNNNNNNTPSQAPADLSDPDLIVTLGGDGTIMHAAHVFSGPVPPILPIAGGSMGFLTPFAREEILDAILIALGMPLQMHSNSNPRISVNGDCHNDRNDYDGDSNTNNNDSYTANGLKLSNRANNNMLVEDITRESYYYDETKFGQRNNAQICISMRMRLDCRIFGSDGTLRSRYNVLNEVVIDRGSSPYLASLECFCDDVHLTTVQADGIIFATPTGSTAYSMAAGGSVVHPAVPSILVTPICPHVLSFRSMIFPDHVILRCYVPSDARSTACVYFDGKHRTELQRGDSVQIEMSAHPVPTINRADHSADWLGSLKRNFNFNTRVRQNPLR